MGRSSKGGWNRKRKAEEQAAKAAAKNDDAAATRGTEYAQIIQLNPSMEAYYAYQGLHNLKRDSSTTKDTPPSFIPCTSPLEQSKEQTQFWNSCRQILPASFRIGQDVPTQLRKSLISELQQHMGKPLEISVTSGISRDATTTLQTIAPVTEIPYVPYGYQLSVDRRTLRRNETLRGFHTWLKNATDAGFVTRQETVSMIPPVVLSPSSNHSILDLCAAPGSKTSQLLEIVSPPGVKAGSRTGYVVANDVDPKRAYMLVHQMKRINSPSILITAVDASVYPQLRNSSKREENTTHQQGIFDRVLADVPCGGDGTLRKNMGIYKHWSQSGSLSLHPLQLQIACCAARQTKVGGRMVYSTCSMNPIENEAVVAELLRLGDGALELVDPREEELGLRGLVARKGWTEWKVLGHRKENEKKHGKNSDKMMEKRKWWAEKRAKEGTANLSRAQYMTANDAANGNVTEAGVEKKDAIEINDADKENGVNGSGSKNIAAAPTKENEETVTNKEEVKKDDENTDTTAKKQKTSSIADTSAATTDEAEPKDGSNKSNGTAPSTTTEDSKPPQTDDDKWNEQTLKQTCLSLGMTPYPTYDALPELERKRIRRSCFPPTTEEAAKFQLEKCLRCLPHDMNTGGFFVALIQKVAPFKLKETFTTTKGERKEKQTNATDVAVVNGDAKTTKVDTKVDTATDAAGNKAETVDNTTTKVTANPNVTTKKTDSKEVTDVAPAAVNSDKTKPVQKPTNNTKDQSTIPKPDVIGEINATNTQKSKEGRHKQKDHNKKAATGWNNVSNANFLVMDDPDPFFAPLINFYKFSPEFPQEQFMARSCGDAKVLYYITSAIKSQLFDTAGIQDGKGITIINSGLKAFARNNKECDVKYRICQDAVEYVSPYMEECLPGEVNTDQKRKLVITDAVDFVTCLNDGAIYLSFFSEGFGNQMRGLESGSFLVCFRPKSTTTTPTNEGDTTEETPMTIVMWKCRADAINCLVSKSDMEGIRSRLIAMGITKTRVDVEQLKKEWLEEHKDDKKKNGQDNYAKKKDNSETDAVMKDDTKKESNVGGDGTQDNKEVK